MQGLGDARRYGFEKRPGLDHRTHLLAQLGQDVLCVIAFAEETAIDPGAQAVPEPADGEVGRDAGQDDDGFLRTVVAGVSCHGCPGDDDHPHGNKLQHSYTAPGQRVLEPLAQGNTHAHRLLHHDDISQREGKKDERNHNERIKP